MSLKGTLAKFTYRKSIGVYVGDRDIVVSQLASTPLGPVELARSATKYEPDQLEESLKQVLAPLIGKRKRFPIPVALGLSGQRVFFTTRPIKASNTDSSPQMLLHEVLQSSSISIDDMVLDVVRTQPFKRPLASIVSCRKKYLTGMLSAIGAAGVNPFRAEPAPAALLRTAIVQHRSPRRAKTVLRLFLGSEQGLAVMAVANLPYAWRYFSLPPGDATTALLSATRTLQTLAKPCGVEAAVDTIMVHGRPDLRANTDLSLLKDEIGISVSWHDTPALDESNIAFGLALGCLTPVTESFDLARILKPRRSLWELFPWGEFATQAALLGCMGLFLADRSSNVNQSFQSLQLKIAEHDWMKSAGEIDLEKEKKDLEQKVNAVGKFLDSRIVWTSYAHDIPTRLPKNAIMNGFEGMCELEVVGKKKDSGKKQKKSMIIRVAAPIPQGGAMPKDVDEFLGELREHPMLKRDFPVVELIDLKWYQPYMGAKPTAYFNVICLPKVGQAAAPPPAAESQH